MIILTGSAGFIGSHIAEALSKRSALMLVDEPEHFHKRAYFLPDKASLMDWAKGEAPNSPHKIVDRKYFLKILAKLHREFSSETESILPKGESIEAVVHIGACTDTSASVDPKYLQEWNIEFSQALWKWCAQEKVPYIYASSAATFGAGEHGFSDSHELVEKLAPLNPYAVSKNEFDKWALAQVSSSSVAPEHWYGLKFFNVYGHQEEHKGAMASPVLHSYRYYQKNGRCRLFRSHKEGIADGEQSRDFIHVSDIVSIIDFIQQNLPESGLYNCGTGKARSFKNMMEALFQAMGKEMEIEWIDTPEQYRKAYQYFTEADMQKLRSAGYSKEFKSLEAGVAEYVALLQKE